jgi:hypothetical protein
MQYVSMVKEGWQGSRAQHQRGSSPLVHAYAVLLPAHAISDCARLDGAEETQFMMALDKTLSKMPKYVGEVYRKVPDLKTEVFLKYKPERSYGARVHIRIDRSRGVVRRLPLRHPKQDRRQCAAGQRPLS